MTIEIYSFLTVFSFFLFNCYFSSHKSPLGNISYFPLSKFCHQLHLLSLSIIQLSHYLLSMILLPGKYNAPTISVLDQSKELLITIFSISPFEFLILMESSQIIPSLLIEVFSKLLSKKFAHPVNKFLSYLDGIFTAMNQS